MLPSCPAVLVVVRGACDAHCHHIGCGQRYRLERCLQVDWGRGRKPPLHCSCTRTCYTSVCVRMCVCMVGLVVVLLVVLPMVLRGAHICKLLWLLCGTQLGSPWTALSHALWD